MGQGGRSLVIPDNQRCLKAQPATLIVKLTFQEVVPQGHLLNIRKIMLNLTYKSPLGLLLVKMSSCMDH